MQEHPWHPIVVPRVILIKTNEPSSVLTENDFDLVKKMHEEQGHAIIEKLQEKMDTTRYNLEASEEVISETPSDAQREKLTRKISAAGTVSQVLKRKFTILKKLWTNKNRKSDAQKSLQSIEQPQ